jgi:TM2 domain-containing membrane protein YozV
MATNQMSGTQRNWLKVTAIFFGFQAIGLIAYWLSWIIFLIENSYFEVLINFIPSLALSILYVGIPVALLIQVWSGKTTARGLALVVIIESALMLFLGVVLNQILEVSAPMPAVGIIGFLWLLSQMSLLYFSEWMAAILPLVDVLGLMLGIGLFTKFGQSAPAGTPLAPRVPRASAATSTSAARGKAYSVQVPFFDDKKLTFSELQELVKQKVVLSTTFVKIGKGKGNSYPAMMIPGLFSDKSFTTAVVLGLVLGNLGIDRFYLGYTGLGILKLLTFGGCGIWGIIDIVLIATRKLPDSTGRPLR